MVHNVKFSTESDEMNPSDYTIIHNIMKKYLILLKVILCSLIVICYSCSNDDGDLNYRDEIIGTIWKLVEKTGDQSDKLNDYSSLFLKFDHNNVYYETRMKGLKLSKYTGKYVVSEDKTLVMEGTPICEALGNKYQFDITGSSFILTAFSQSEDKTKLIFRPNSDFSNSGDESSNGDNQGGQDNTNNEGPSTDKKTLFGLWTEEDSYGLKFYHFLNNGECYYENRDFKNEGIRRRVYTWDYKNNTLTFTSSDDKFSYSVSFNASYDKMTLNYGSSSSTYYRVNSEGTTDVKYKEAPYTCYVYDKGGSLYYPIYKAVERVYHSTSSNVLNTLYLQFFGKNGEFSPTGGYVLYCTPGYQGIQSNWDSGTYPISDLSASNLYAYKVPLMNCGGYDASGGTGTLKVIKNSNGVVYDLKTDYIILHFESK